MKQDSGDEDEDHLIMVEVTSFNIPSSLLLTRTSLVQISDDDKEFSGSNPPISGGPRLGGLPPLGEPRRRRKGGCCGGDENCRQDVSTEQKPKGIRKGKRYADEVNAV